MSPRTLRALAMLVAALTAALVATTVTLVVATGGAAANQFDQAWAEIVAAVVVLTGTGAGLAIVLQRPRNRIGWILLVPGFALALEDMAVPAITTTHVILRSPMLATEVFAVLSDALWLPSFGFGVAALFLLFPDGQPVGPRSRWALRAVVVAGAVFAVATILRDAPLYALAEVDNPLGLAGTDAWLEPAQGMSLLVVFASIVTGLASLVVRWRRSSGRERAQLKWFLAAACLVPLTVVPVAILEDPSGTSGSSWGLVVEASIMTVPVAIAVAILRHRLYDIDRIISRTVSYAAITGLLVTIYAASVVVLRAALQPVTPDSDLAVAGSTLVVAALFGPVRRRVQTLVDRRFNRARYDGAQAVESFGQRLRDEVDLDEVAAELRGTVATTVQPASVSLWVSTENRS